MTSALLHRTAAELRADSHRVIARLFLPGEEPHRAQSRAAAIVARVIALPESEVVRLTTELVSEFSGRHRAFPQLLERHAAVIAARLDDTTPLSSARTQLVGAAFTAEYSTEGAALMNPSAMLSPDQSGLPTGQVRVALSLRAVGEGHLSSITFCSALVGPGPRWEFETRVLPAVSGTTSTARWTTGNLRSVLGDQGPFDELGRALLHALPAEFDTTDLERAIVDLFPELVLRPGGQASVDAVHRLVQSAYAVTFDPDVHLSQRVLHPTVPEECNGMEDARFTCFVPGDGVVEYRGTYTAYDGRHIEPRLLQSADLQTFQAHRLAGDAARNKGMALFPRLVGGRHLALCRTDGENTSLARSDDGFTWSDSQVLHRPRGGWELLQVGNCGPPIETENGWLVLTHAVGAMRVYTISALLLDLDDPSRIIGSLTEPLLRPDPGERDGYVPSVVYSCGGVVHDGRLWIPYGIDDSRIGVAWVVLTELIERMVAPG